MFCLDIGTKITKEHNKRHILKVELAKRLGQDQWSRGLCVCDMNMCVCMYEHVGVCMCVNMCRGNVCMHVCGVNMCICMYVV